MMTPKMQAFVSEYLVDHCAAKAARRAGYSERTAAAAAAKLMARPDIQEAIAKACEQQQKRTGITADYVLTRLQTIVETCMEPGSWDAAQANRSLELLGKHLKMWTDKQEQVVSGPGGGPVQQEVQVTFVRPKHD